MHYLWDCASWSCHLMTFKVDVTVVMVVIIVTTITMTTVLITKTQIEECNKWTIDLSEGMKLQCYQQLVSCGSW